jgi:sensor histidine kinase regulating citrate/malate metabolism
VLNRGGTYATMIDRLGVEYYSAYKPIRDINGEIIGMVSVGVPANLLIESTRQQLVTTFLIVMFLSLLAVLVGYGAVRSIGKDRGWQRFELFEKK